MYKITGHSKTAVQLIDDFDNEVYMKWDGCVEITNIYGYVSYHYCDLEETIAALQELQKNRTQPLWT